MTKLVIRLKPEECIQIAGSVVKNISEHGVKLLIDGNDMIGQHFFGDEENCAPDENKGE